MFVLLGACGQAIHVDPVSRTVMVHTAARLHPSDPNRETMALWRGVIASVGAAAR